MRNLSLYAAGALAIACLLFVVALLFTRATLSEVKLQRDDARASLRVSNASVISLKAELARVLEDQMVLANGDANRISASRQAVAIADAAGAARQTIIDRLRASADTPGAVTATAACDVSATVMEIWP